MTRRGPEAVQDGALLLGFVSLGAVGAAVPASLPGSGLRLGVPASELLPAVSLLFLGLFAGVLVAAAPRRGSARTLLPVGSALQAAGLALLAAAPTVPAFFAAALVTGLGFGLVEASATALTRARSAQGTPARLAALNGAAAVAAALAPLLLAFAPPAGLWVPIAALALVPAAGAVLASAARTSWPVVSSRERSRRGGGDGGDGRGGGAARRLWPVAVALFLFVGAETILSGWSSTLPEAMLGLPAAGAAVGTTVFWTLMAVGRFVCTAILARGVPPRVCFTVACAAGTLLAVVGALVGHGIGAALLVCAVVVFVAPGYALLLGSALARVPQTGAARTASVLVAVGAAGGSVISFALAATAGADPAAVLVSVAGLLAVSGLVARAAAR